MAVGFADGATISVTLTEMWNGVSWTIVPSPNGSPTQPNQLNGVSCTSASSCVAVGSYATNGSRERSDARRILGRPQLDDGHGPSTLDRDRVPHSELRRCGLHRRRPAVSAVGSYTIDLNTDQTLVESWNGHTWSVVPSADTSSTDRNFLNSVSCATPTNCVAVGEVNNTQTLAEVWNGTTWSVTPTPNAPGGSNQLWNGVSCTNPILLHGRRIRRHRFEPAVAHRGVERNGVVDRLGTETPASFLNSDENFLLGVSCIDPSSCVAAGHWSNTGDVKDSTLIESWDGTAWTIVPSPNTSAPKFNDLNAVSCGVARNASAARILGACRFGPDARRAGLPCRRPVTTRWRPTGDCSPITRSSRDRWVATR